LLGVPLIVGVFAALQRRRFSQWPAYTVSRCARSRFMIDYFRVMPIFERMGKAGEAAFAVFCCVVAINWTLSAASGVRHAELVFLACLILLVEGLMTFLAVRYVVTTLLALAPRARWAMTGSRR
jgi:hypothetical protein